MSVVRVDLRTKRHKVRGKEAIEALLGCIEGIEHEVAGYAIIVWDDTGRSAFNIEEGGPVSLASVGAYASSKFNSVAPPAIVASK